MNRSDDINELVEALAKAQSEFKPVLKQNENPQYHSKYADLATLIEATQPALVKHGLVCVQDVGCIVETSTTIIETMLAHVSGQFISATLHLPATMRERFDAQSVGSSQTYGRRYAMQAILGVAAEVDDDGTDAVGGGSKAAAKAEGERQLAHYKERIAQQVKGKKLEFHKEMLGDMEMVVFHDSDTLAIMLENGLKDLTLFSDQLKARVMPDDPENKEKCKAIADRLGVTLHGVTPSAPMAAPPANIPPADAPPHRIGSAQELTKGKKTWLAVKWDGHDYSVWDAALWPAIVASIGQSADFEWKGNVVNGKEYRNILKIKKLGNREYDEHGEPIRTPEDGKQVSLY